ncbi:MAG: flagellar protein FlaG [Campylobacterales bacterium]|nr:flagellar protein FlaG [Campylobacterales bacterium]
MEVKNTLNQSSVQSSYFSSNLKNENMEGSDVEKKIVEDVTKESLNKSTTELNKENEENIKKQLENLTKDLNLRIEILDTNIEFNYNDKIDALYVNVMDKRSQQVIRRIPSDEFMRLSEKMKEVIGLLFDQKG